MRTPNHHFGFRVSGFGFLLLPLLLAGCVATEHYQALTETAYRPDNVFLAAKSLPPQVRRVLVLPLVCDDQNQDQATGRETIEPLLSSELVKLKKLEVVSLASVELRARTGQTAWNGEGTLPEGFLERVRGATDCDAILFGRLTVFRPYPPLAVGCRLRLVDARSGETLWAGDEVFDAGQPSVVSGLIHHRWREQLDVERPADDWADLHSPRRFGQYALAELLRTLPAR